MRFEFNCQIPPLPMPSASQAAPLGQPQAPQGVTEEPTPTPPGDVARSAWADMDAHSESTERSWAIHGQPQAPQAVAEQPTSTQMAPPRARPDHYRINPTASSDNSYMMPTQAALNNSEAGTEHSYMIATQAALRGGTPSPPYPDPGHGSALTAWSYSDYSQKPVLLEREDAYSNVSQPQAAQTPGAAVMAGLNSMVIPTWGANALEAGSDNASAPALVEANRRWAKSKALPIEGQGQPQAASSARTELCGSPPPFGSPAVQQPPQRQTAKKSRAPSEPYQPKPTLKVRGPDAKQPSSRSEGNYPAVFAKSIVESSVSATTAATGGAAVSKHCG